MANGNHGRISYCLRDIFRLHVYVLKMAICAHCVPWTSSGERRTVSTIWSIYRMPSLIIDICLAIELRSRSSKVIDLGIPVESAYATFSHHRLRGSASPVLTATHSYGSLAWLSDFFPAHLWRSDPQPILTQNGSNDVDSRKGVPFAVKIATFHTHWSPGSLKGQNFANFWT